jgi:hypothetical protein
MLLAPFNTTIVLCPGVTGFVVKLTVVPGGLPLALSEIGPLKPPVAVVPRVMVIFCGAGQSTTAAEGVLNVKPEGKGTVLVQTPLP